MAIAVVRWCLFRAAIPFACFAKSEVMKDRRAWWIEEGLKSRDRRGNNANIYFEAATRRILK